jgi:hypothetical protein
MRAVPADSELLTSLVQVGRAVAGEAARDHAPVLLADRPGGGAVVQVGDLVVKAHRAGADPAALAARLRIAAHPLLREVLLAPLPVPPEASPRAGTSGPSVAGTGRLLLQAGDRLVSVWPAGETVSPTDPDAAPWAQAARLLARLHALPAGRAAGSEPPPPAGGPARVARALARMRAVEAAPARAAVLQAAAGLPPWARGHAEPAASRARDAALVHGDWHLGQLVRHAGQAAAVTAGPGPRTPATRRAGGWRLIDVDDLGSGDPAWDLARAAALLAAGLLAPVLWERFLAAYRAAGGRALPPDGDPWPVLDVPARALTVQMAALGTTAAGDDGRPLDGVETALVDACRRIAAFG